MGACSPAAAAAQAATAASATARWPRRRPHVCLPNGLTVQCISRRDVPFLYQEVWERRCYLQHAELPPGGTVLDLGSNIGLFALQAAEALGPQGLVVACEPLPPTFDCLQRNIAEHRRWAERQQHSSSSNSISSSSKGSGTHVGFAAAAGPAPIVALCAGVSDGSAASAEFTLYPRAAGWSSLRPASAEEMQASMAAFLDNALASQAAATAAGLDPLTAAAGRWLRAAAPAWAFAAVRHAAVSFMLGGAQRFACPLLSVQQLVRGVPPGVTGTAGRRLGGVAEQAAAGLELASRGIDLLKVDVERAELDVLRGVGGKRARPPSFPPTPHGPPPPPPSLSLLFSMRLHCAPIV